MIVSMRKNGLDPRLYAYLQKRREGNTIDDGIVFALTEIFQNVTLPAGQLLPDLVAASLGWEEIEKRALDARNNLWKALMKLDFYIFLYKKTDEEAAQIKKETGLILSAYT